MGADKNSSPKRELGLCPKFTTKDPHMSLPKSRSHNGPTNPRSKPRTSITAPSIMDCPRWARGPSASSRTIRHSSTDHPRTPYNKNPPTKWIERKTRKNSWRTQRTLGLSGSSQTVRHVPADCPPGGIPAARARPLEGQLHLPFARSPESTKGLLPNHRWRQSVSRRCYTYEFAASNPLNREESRFYRAQEQS
jgi:hypothetical protein